MSPKLEEAMKKWEELADKTERRNEDRLFNLAACSLTFAFELENIRLLEEINARLAKMDKEEE